MPHDDLNDLIRRTYVRPVDEDVAAGHLEAMRAAVREPAPSPSVRAPAPRRRRPLWRPALATGLALVALPAGLAAAGVDLPDAVNAPFEAVGVELPNQTSNAPDDAPATDERRPAVAPRPASPSTTRTTPADARSQGRRGEEASDGKRRGDDRSRRDEAPAKGPRDNAAQQSTTKKPNTNAPAGSNSRGAEQRSPSAPAGSKSRGAEQRSPAAPAGSKSRGAEKRSSTAPAGSKRSGQSTTKTRPRPKSPAARQDPPRSGSAVEPGRKPVVGDGLADGQD